MRVIAGSAGGRKLFAPKGRDVRPTSDRVKEALFSIVGGEVEGAAVLDLFCGSGALGIEALSRGAERATFVDSSASSIDLTKRNLEHTGLIARSEVLLTAVSSWLRRGPALKRAYNLIFLDPPYGLGNEQIAGILHLLAVSGLVADDAAIVLEQSAKSPAPEVKELELIERRRYGDTALTFYAKALDSVAE